MTTLDDEYPGFTEEEQLQLHAEELEAIQADHIRRLVAIGTLHGASKTWLDVDVCRTCKTPWPCPTYQICTGVIDR